MTLGDNHAETNAWFTPPQNMGSANPALMTIKIKDRFTYTSLCSKTANMGQRVKDSSYFTTHHYNIS